MVVNENPAVHCLFTLVHGAFSYTVHRLAASMLQLMLLDFMFVLS